MNGLTRILTAAAAVLAATLTAEEKPAAPLSSRTDNVRIARIEDRIKGYGGETFTIERPEPRKMETVHAEDFGMS